MQYPWHFAKDMNGDGFFTITDVFKLFGQLFFLPGDSIIYYLLTYCPDFSRFIELGPDNYHGLLSFILSIISWAYIIGAPLGLFIEIKEWFENRAKKKSVKGGTE